MPLNIRIIASNPQKIALFLSYGAGFTLREITATRQNSPYTKKRWFTDPDMDLFIWHRKEELVRFQLSYNKQASENIDETITDFIYTRLLEYPGHHARSPNGEPVPGDL